MEKSVKITWLGHACFELTADNYSIIIDPYTSGSVPGLKLPPLTADAVYSSHQHRDHYDPTAVSLKDSHSPSPFKVSSIESFHDNKGGTQRGKNLIHIFEYGSLRLAHFGDLGCPLTAEQKKGIGTLDAAMVPVGGHYTIDAIEAKALVSALNIKVVIPMHYRNNNFGFDVLDPLQKFLSLCTDVVRYDSNTVILDEDTKKQTAVLRYLG